MNNVIDFQEAIKRRYREEYDMYRKYVPLIETRAVGEGDDLRYEAFVSDAYPEVSFITTTGSTPEEAVDEFSMVIIRLNSIKSEREKEAIHAVLSKWEDNPFMY